MRQVAPAGGELEALRQAHRDLEAAAAEARASAEAEVRRARRVISDCHFSVQLNHFIPVFL